MKKKQVKACRELALAQTRDRKIQVRMFKNFKRSFTGLPHNQRAALLKRYQDTAILIRNN